MPAYPPPFLGDAEEEPPVPRGLPRPLFAGWPVPFNTPTEPRPGGRVPMFRNHDDRRQGEVFDKDLCMVCGESLRSATRVIAVVDAETGRVVDEAGMHERCGRMALVWCPWLRDNAQVQVRSLPRRLWRRLRREDAHFGKVDFRGQGRPFDTREPGPVAEATPPKGCPAHSR